MVTPVYTVVGKTKHFRISYGTTLGPIVGQQRALELLAVIEQDYAVVKSWWPDTSYTSKLPVDVRLDDPTLNFGGPAYWLGPSSNYETILNTGPNKKLNQNRHDFACELLEHFASRQNKGWFYNSLPTEGSIGESLSLVAGRELARTFQDPSPLHFGSWAQDWLNDGGDQRTSDRADYVNHTIVDWQSEPNYQDILGCGMLFINWLRYSLGYSMKDICTHPATTLRGVYQRLTGKKTDPFPLFKAQLAAAFPPNVDHSVTTWYDWCNPYPLNAPPPPPPPPPKTGITYASAGTTTHFHIFYDTTLNAAGQKIATDYVGNIEKDYQLVKSWWPDTAYTATLPVNVWLDNTADPNNKYANYGAFWGIDPNYGTHVNTNNTANVNGMRSQFIAELNEHFQSRQNKGWFQPGGGEGSNGEALSIMAAREFGHALNEPTILKESGWSQAWLNSDRNDYINTTVADYFNDRRDGYAEILGCGVLFINWLRYSLGFTMQEICQHPSPTLRGVYKSLTGKTANPFTQFSTQLKTVFPTTETADLSTYSDVCNPYPLVVPTPPPPTPPPPPRTAGHTLAGTTEHFRIYYDNRFNVADGQGRAHEWLKVVERDFAVVKSWFRDVEYLTSPVTLLMDLAPAGGAYWLPGIQFETHLNLDESTDLGVLRMYHVAELSEQFMKLQDRGWWHDNTQLEGTNGEALSVVMGRELGKQIDAGTVGLYRFIDSAWLNSATRANWVGTSLDSYGTTTLDAVGCDVLFIYYLMYQLGFTLQEVTVAAAPTLREVYRNLTNDPTDPFPAFKALVDSRYPHGTPVPNPLLDDTFPIGDAATLYPGADFVLDPAATIRGHVDGVSISGASSSFTTTTELTQFATGDVVIPPVTSGSPLAAVDLAWQLAGNNRLTYFVNTGTYWSLQGHETGIDVKKQKAVVGRDESVYRLFNEKVVNGVPSGAVYRCWRVRDSYSSFGWAPYSDAIYSTAGQGSSVSVVPQTRTHIVATTRPGVTGGVQFTFGSSFVSNGVGFGPSNATAGLGKTFTISLNSTALSITGSYFKKGGAETLDQQQFASTLGLGITGETVVQLLISLEWTDASTFTIQAWAALPDFTTVSATLKMTNTGIDLFAAPWKHTGPIRGLFVETVKLQDDTIDGRIGPYETTVPVRSTLPDFGVDTTSMILGMTGSLWDYLSQVCVARQIDLRNDNGVLAIAPMTDVGYQSFMWEPVASPSLTYGSDNTAKFIEVVQNLATWDTFGATLYDTRKSSDSFSVTPGTTSTFSVSTNASATLYYTPAPVGGPSSVTADQIKAANALVTGSPEYNDAWRAINLASESDALRDVREFQTETLHAWGAYCISGTFNTIAGHSMVAKEWIAYGGTLQVKPVDATSAEITVYAPVIPGWDGDYLIGFHGDKDYPLLRLVGTGITYRPETVRFSTGANPNTTTEVGSTIENVAATTRRIVANLASRAITEACGPSMQLSAAISMKEVRSWQLTLGLIPGSTLLYRNMQWRILSATLSNNAVSISAAPFTTYQSSYWHYNWDDLKVDQFLDYWQDSNWDDYKVAPLSGAIAEWTNSGGMIKHTLFPTPDPNDPSVPLEPSETLLPSRFLLPYAGALGNFATVFPGSNVFPGGQVAP